LQQLQINVHRRILLLPFLEAIAPFLQQGVSLSQNCHTYDFKKVKGSFFVATTKRKPCDKISTYKSFCNLIFICSWQTNPHPQLWNLLRRFLTQVPETFYILANITHTHMNTNWTREGLIDLCSCACSWTFISFSLKQVTIHLQKTTLKFIITVVHSQYI
jgi:hypothetical protein